MEDLYKILEISNDASKEQIRENYRRLAFKYHPDTNSESVNDEEKFKEVNYAYSILSDSSKRDEYDNNNYKFNRNSITNEKAQKIFIENMYVLAFELTMNNVSWKKISLKLIEKGCPQRIAELISLNIEKQRKSIVRKEAIGLFKKHLLL